MEVCYIVRVSCDFAPYVDLGVGDFEREFYCRRRSSLSGWYLYICVGVSGFATEVARWISLSRAYGTSAAIYHFRAGMHSLWRVPLVSMTGDLLSSLRHPELVSGSTSPFSQAVIGAGWMQINQCTHYHPRVCNGIALIGSREDAKAQRGRDSTHYLCGFASSREILSIGYIKHWVPAFAGMTDGLGPIHD